jgi:hypothetical protein
VAIRAPKSPRRPATEHDSAHAPAPQGKSVARNALASSSPAILVALVVLLPFLGKAHTIDDVTFLLQAQHVLTDPLHPTALDMVFHGERIRLSRDLVTGPVMAYLLAPAVILGGAEWLVHALQVVLLACGAHFTAALSLRLGQDRTQAALASLFVVASPAVLAMTATAMPDVPAMVFGVTGMERLVAAQQEKGRFAAWLGALLLGMAALSRPHALLLFPCAALILTDVRTLRCGLRGILRQWTTPRVLTLGLGIAVWGAVVLLTRDPLSGATVARASFRRVEVSNVAFNLASFLLHWSVAFPLGVLWAALRGRAFFLARRTPRAFVAGFVLAMVGMYIRFGLASSLVAVLLICFSLGVVVDIVAVAWRARNERTLALVLWLLVGAATAGYVHLPAKVLVPSAPAMALLIAAQLHAARRDRRTTTIVGLTVTVSVVVAVLVIKADAALAEVGREGGSIVGAYRAHGERVWFDGGWGFQWYAMKAGATALADTGPFPHAGDVVVAGLTARLVNKDYPNKTLLYRRIYNAPGGRLFDGGAGFFENLSGPFPWAWSRSEIGRIEAWRIGQTAMP